MGACIGKRKNIIITKINKNNSNKTKKNSNVNKKKKSKFSKKLDLQEYNEINLSTHSVNSIPFQSPNNNSNMFNSNIIIVTDIKSEEDNNINNIEDSKRYDINSYNVNNDNSLGEILNLFNY